MANSADSDQFWIYTICKGRVYLDSAGPGLKIRDYSISSEYTTDLITAQRVSIVQFEPNMLQEIKSVPQVKSWFPVDALSNKICQFVSILAWSW